MDCNCDGKPVMGMHEMTGTVDIRTPGRTNTGSEDVLAPQSATEKGMGNHDGVASGDARDEKASSAQTPPITDCEATVVTAPQGDSPNARDPHFGESRRMDEHNAGRTTDIGDSL